jgi:proline dehydrogenase
VALLDRAIVEVLPLVPRWVVQRLAARYIAGETLADAVRVVRELNEAGKLATIDVLGEEVSSADEARAIAGQYHDVLAAVEDEKLDANISIKLTAIGLEVDLDLCRDHVEALVVDAGARGNFVRIDMEDSSTTDRTLQLYRDVCDGGYSNLGVVLQARLRRTASDVEDLRNVRVCKGIYVEPPERAYRDADAIRRSYLATLEALVRAGAYVAIATHDEYLIAESLRIVESLPRERYELQMLLGVRSERADELVAAGHRVRIYVPFGTRWYEYSLRRMQENPAVARYVAMDTLNRLRGH